MFYGAVPSSNHEPNNLVLLQVRKLTLTVSHAEPEQPEQDKPTDQGEKLVEIKLSTQGDEVRPVL